MFRFVKISRLICDINMNRSLCSRALNAVKVQHPPVEMFSKQNNEEFLSYFPEIVDTLIDVKPWNGDKQFQTKLKEVIEYNVNFWTNSRGIATVSAYKSLEKPENLTKENIKSANILGWCGRLYEASLLIQDDIVDNSETRGNKLCWYKNNGVGTNVAIVDASYLATGVFPVLRKYFSKHPQYQALLHLFHDINFEGALSQSLDSMPWDVKKFNMDHYKLIAKGKGEPPFSFISMAMYLANYSENLHKQIIPVINDMGLYYQIQNDYLDFFGDPSATGKDGTDIEKGACSWLAVKALEKASSAQRRLIAENYGKSEAVSVAIIRDLYNDLNVKDDYIECERIMYKKIYSKISELPKDLNRDFFFTVLNALFDQLWLP